ncbi:hypothetical protein [Roseibium sp. TrichSKD4]|uniref:hypothetical protein n=1 Tax=Roseibium sp. TrichSKD4 TaxID=744980 RepID=UPI00030B88F8|nr:hypothetical protein [Roseibium sp. TrichSKD4]
MITALISSNAINDTALVALTGGHYDAPHGEPDPSGLAHAFSCMFVGINADDYSDGTHTVQAKRMVRKHGEHYDVWNIEVTFTVDSTLFFDAITKLRATVTAVHQHSKPGPQKKHPPIVDEKGLSESVVENIRKKLSEWEKTHQTDK